MYYYPITLLIQYLSFAVSIICFKFMVTLGAVSFGAAVRLFLSSLIMVYFCKMKKISFIEPLFKIPGRLIAGSLFRTFFPGLFGIWTLKYISPTKYSFFYNLSPFVSAFFSWLIVKERMTAHKVMGMIIGCSGIIPILMVKSQQEMALFSDLVYFSLPEFGVIAAIASMSYGWVSMKKLLLVHPGLSIAAVRLYDAVFSCICFFIVALFFEKKWLFDGASLSTFLMYSVLIVIFSILIGNNLNAWHVRKLSATLTSLGTLSVPFFVALLSWIFFGQPIEVELIASSILVLIGTSIFYKEELFST